MWGEDLSTHLPNNSFAIRHTSIIISANPSSDDDDDDDDEERDRPVIHDSFDDPSLLLCL